MKKKRSSWAIPYSNRSINVRYKILKRLEAGIILTGIEVKYLLAGRFDLTRCRVDFDSKKNELFLENALIGGTKEKQKILLNRSEINRLAFEKQKERAIILVQELYFKRNNIKLGLVLVKKVRQGDKKKLLKKLLKNSF